jgi:chondroitin sulfate synthase
MCGRRVTVPTMVPHWVTLTAGLLLGCVLTSTFTFHMRWCSDKVALGDLSLDRQTVSIIKVNEHIRAHGKGIAVEGQWERNVDRRESDWEECMCGEELKRLKSARDAPTEDMPQKYGVGSLDPTFRASNLVTKPSIATFSPYWNTTNTSRGDPYLFNPSLTTADKLPREQLLSEEFRVRRSFVVAVDVPDDGLEWASKIYDSWGGDVPHIIFFISNSCNKTEPESVGLPLVEISGVNDSKEGGSSIQKSFAILQYLHQNYREAFNWFLLVGTQTFIRAKRMEQILSRLDQSSEVYLGWAAKGRPEDADFLQLLPREFYCLGSAGMALSNAALKTLGGQLPVCLEEVSRHNRETPKAPWTSWDVEVGRCVSRTLGIQCSQSAEAKAYFYQDFSPKTKFSKKALSLPPFTNLLAYSPVTSLSGHAHLHFHYKRREYHDSLEMTRYLQEEVNTLCTELDEGEKCPVYVCPCQESATSVSCSSNCPAADTVTTLSKPYMPVSKYDIPTWQYFDSLAVYNDETTIPSYWFNVRKDWKKEIQSVMNQVLLEARAHTGRRLLKFRKIINGYARHNPFRGMEYIIDAEYTEGRTLVKTRTSVVRPIAKNYITLEDNDDKKTQINFIMPISNVNERFKEFMSMYESCCMKQDTALHLVLVVYGEQDVAFVKEFIHPFLKKYKKAKITVVEGTGVFSRGRALHLGMSTLGTEELAFHCDVDMTIQTPFLQRCRKNAIRGKRVYYPEFFKLYNLDYVYINRPRPKKIPLKRQHGHWASYSFGMLCIYKSDYDEVGGMDTTIIGWGEEDVKFYEMVLKRKNLEVFRAPDVGLTHRWHEKHCPTSLSAEQKKHCISSRGENLADRIELAGYIYRKGYQIVYPESPPTNSSLSSQFSSSNGA